MDFVLETTLTFLTEIVHHLNQPATKQSIKNVAALMTCIFGLMEFISFIYNFKKRPSDPNAPLFFARASIFLSLLITPLGLLFISKIALILPFQVDHLFGSNTVFALNPWHPKHIASIMAVSFALPALISKFTNKAHSKISNWIFFVLLFNTLTSRPIMHLANQLALKLFK